jgi:hypothetical protein
MESRKTSHARNWRERLWLPAFVILEAALLWQSFAPWLLRQVAHGD